MLTKEELKREAEIAKSLGLIDYEKENKPWRGNNPEEVELEYHRFHRKWIPPWIKSRLAFGDTDLWIRNTDTGDFIMGELKCGTAYGMTTSQYYHYKDLDRDYRQCKRYKGVYLIFTKHPNFLLSDYIAINHIQVSPLQVLDLYNLRLENLKPFDFNNYY